MVWAALGFVGGALFWHGVGTWSSPSSGAGGEEEIAAASTVASGADPIDTGSLPSIYLVNPANCTSLELDRQANRTVMRPCPAEGLALRLDGGNERGDLSVLAAGYAIAEPGP